MTTKDTLRVLRELRQQLRIVTDNLEGRLPEESPAIRSDLAEARMYSMFAFESLGKAMEKMSPVVPTYKQLTERQDVRNIMKRLADA